MENFSDVNQLLDRSPERIRDLGEVFTPESSVQDMLNLLCHDNEDIWSDEEISFFESYCGHGNIVAVIYKKRINAIYRKASSGSIKDPALYAVANAINTSRAIAINE